MSIQLTESEENVSTTRPITEPRVCRSRHMPAILPPSGHHAGEPNRSGPNVSRQWPIPLVGVPRSNCSSFLPPCPRLPASRIVPSLLTLPGAPGNGADRKMFEPLRSRRPPRQRHTPARLHRSSCLPAISWPSNRCPRCCDLRRRIAESISDSVRRQADSRPA